MHTSLNSSQNEDRYRKLQGHNDQSFVNLTTEMVQQRQQEDDDGVFWNERDHEYVATNKSLNKAKKLFTRQRHQMTEAALDIELLQDPDTGVEYVYNELESQGKEYEKQESSKNMDLTNS